MLPQDYIGPAIWLVNGQNNEVTITGFVGERDGEHYFSAKGTNTGLPGSQLSILIPSTNGHDPVIIAAALRALPPGPRVAAQKAMAAEFADILQHWQIRTLKDAYAPRPIRQYVIYGLLQVPSLNIVYGPPGCLKTLLMIDAGVNVAAGLPWLPPIPGKAGNGRQTMQAPVLWIDMDNGKFTMDERVEAMARVRKLPENTPFFYVTMPSPWLDASDETNLSFTELRTQAIDCGARFIIIDNLGLAAGSVDENSADMARVLSAFRRLAEDTGAAVVLIHHQRKPTGFKTRTGNTLRGHSSIEASLDLALLVERDEYSDTIMVRATKVRGPDVYPFGGIFTYEHKLGTDELIAARFFGLEIEDTTSDRAIQRAILEAVKISQPVNKKDLVTAVKDELPDIGLTRLKTAIDWMVHEGKLSTQPGYRTEKLYTLPGSVAVSLNNEI